MKLTTGIVALALTAGTAWGQNPAIIQNTKDALNGAQQQKTAASNAALQGTTPAKPSGAVPAKSSAAAPSTAAACSWSGNVSANLIELSTVARLTASRCGSPAAFSC